MLNDFLIFVAPFLIIIAGVVVVFSVAAKDGSVTKEK